MSLFAVPNQFGQQPDPVQLKPKTVSVDQAQYADLGPSDEQGTYESPEHFFARINREEPDDD